MSQQYLLPCECGEKIPVDTSQAGSAVTCGCGRTVDVPSMRAIRQLEAAEPGEARRPRAQWNPQAGVVFVSGILLALLAGATGFWCHLQYRGHEAHRLSAGDVQQWTDALAAEVDQATPDQLLDMWQQERERGLGRHDDSPFVAAARGASWYVLFRNVLAVVAVCGVALAASSALFRRPAR